MFEKYHKAVDNRETVEWMCLAGTTPRVNARQLVTDGFREGGAAIACSASSIVVPKLEKELKSDKKGRADMDMREIRDPTLPTAPGCALPVYDKDRDPRPGLSCAVLGTLMSRQDTTVCPPSHFKVFDFETAHTLAL